MSSLARTIAALLFVAALGFVLTVPLRDLDGARDGELPAVASSLESSPASSVPSPSQGVIPIPATLRFANRYPRQCLEPVQAPNPGLVAAYRAGRVTVATTDGEARASFAATPPISFSPSGNVVAAGPQGLFWRTDGSRVLLGDVQHGMVFDKRGLWGWSPISDCGLQTDRDGHLYVTTANPQVVSDGVAVTTGAPLLKRPVESFAFSPNGRLLALIINFHQRSVLGLADLKTGRVTLLDAGCCLVGWSPDSRIILRYRWPNSASIAFDGVRLRGIRISGRRSDFDATILPWRRSIFACGEQLLAIEGGYRDVTDSKRLAFLEPEQPPDYISPPEPAYMGASCSPGATFIAAVSTPPIMERGPIRQRLIYSRRIRLLTRTGDVVREVVDDPGWGDDHPEWGPHGTGLLFVRLHRGGAPQVWFVPGGGTPRSLGLGVAQRGFTYGHYPWGRFLDWSATPPSGLPAGS